MGDWRDFDGDEGLNKIRAISRIAMQLVVACVDEFVDKCDGCWRWIADGYCG